MKVSVTYLINSGFLLRIDDTLLLFDDYRDPSAAVDQAIREGMKDFYIFASHAHFDHFDKHILDYAKEATAYIFGYDIRHTKRVREFPRDKTVYMETYAEWENEDLLVNSFDSTDAGVSFLVRFKRSGKSIFHAGDFNWWDWTGEDRETRKLAENAFKKQMKRIAGMQADIAFFPVDGRLETSMERGAKVFVRETDVKNLITMHSIGYPAWQPGGDFFGKTKEIPVWSPRVSGETREYII